MRLALSVFLLLLSSAPFAQENTQPFTPTEPSATQIIQFLGQTIEWYRQTQQEQRIATEPGDLGFTADNRRMADQVVKLAFDFSRQEEQQLAKQLSKGAPPDSGEMGSRFENLSRAAARA